MSEKREIPKMTKPKKFVFVLMPFDESFNDIYAYGIKQTCSDLHTFCERVDEQNFSERILDRIYNQIAKADIIVADMTGRNPNVFYEVGYAHALGKNVILLTQKADDIPFDLKHFPHIIYNGQIKTLSTLLKTKLEWFLNDETSQQAANYDFGLEFLIDGIPIHDNTIIQIDPYRHINWDFYKVKMDIYNSSPKIYESTFKLGFEMSADHTGLIYGLNSLKPSKDSILFISNEISNLFPGAYESIEFGVRRGDVSNGTHDIVPMKLKIFTSFELREIIFKMDIPTQFKFNL